MQKEEIEVSKEVKLALIEEERKMWHNTRQQITFRHRVNKRLELVNGMKNCEDELENCEKALDELDAIEEEIKNS